MSDVAHSMRPSLPAPRRAGSPDRPAAAPAAPSISAHGPAHPVVLPASEFHRIAPSRVEALLATLTFFVLFVDLPARWFADRTTGVPAGADLEPVFMLCMVVYGLFNLSFRLERYLAVLISEPLLPIMLGLIAASSLWSEVPSTALDAAVSFSAITAVGIWLYVRFPLRTILGFAAAAVVAGLVLNVVFVFALPQYGVGESGWHGTFLYRNLLGRGATISLAVLVVAVRVHRRWRLVLLAAIALNLGLMVGSQSKTAVVGGAVVLGMSLWVPLFRSRRTLYGAVAIAFAGMVFGFGLMVYGNLASISASLGRSANLTGRTELWPEVVRQIRARPVWGYGFGGFWTGWGGPSAVVWKRAGFVAAHSHNALLELATGLGLVGVTVWMTMFVRAIVRAARVVRYFAGPVGVLPMMVLAAVVTTSVTEYGILDSDLFFMMFVLAVFAAARGRREALAASLAQLRVG